MDSKTNRSSTKSTWGQRAPSEDTYVKPRLMQLSVDETMSGLTGAEVEGGRAPSNPQKRPS